MTKYNITFKKSVAKDLRSLPNADIKRILLCIDSLASNPRADGCIKLSGQERYRVRQGVYRIIYEIRDQQLLVLIVRIRHRKNAY